MAADQDMNRFTLLRRLRAHRATGTYTTTFRATENPLSEGGRWINGLATGLDWNNVRTSSGVRAYGTQSGTVNFDDSIAVLTGTFGNDQTAIGVVSCANPVNSTDASAGVAEEVELLLRFSISAHDAHGYECTISVVPSNQYVQFNRWNGGLGNFTQLASQAPSVTIGTGDWVRGRASGTVLTIDVSQNAGASWTTVLSYDTAPDTTKFSTGSAGIGFYYSNGSGRGTYATSDYGWSSFQVVSS